MNPPKPRLSILITASTEHKELKRLLDDLVPQLLPERHQLCILIDPQTMTEAMSDLLWTYFDFMPMELREVLVRYMTWPLNGDFAQFKNKGLEMCTGQAVLQLDADEELGPKFLSQLEYVLDQYADVDAFTIARRNLVEGITPEDLQRWRWVQNELGWINYPDRQMRVFRTGRGIQWEGRVHERLTGYRTLGPLPESIFLWHIKDIERQRRQNDFYNTFA